MDFGIVTASQLGGLNEVEGDLCLDAKGDIVVVRGVDAIVQHIRVRFNTFRGEVFTDLRIGFPWFEEVFVKGVSLQRVRSLVERTILTTPGIAEVNDLTLNHDRVTRRLTIRFRARTTDGAVINSDDYAPFVLEAA